jgi:agmatine deiminase
MGTPIIYTSERLRINPKTAHIANSIHTALKEKLHIEHRELKNTNNYWCRDYMPVQNSIGELIQFKYEPSYLRGKKEWEESRSDVHKVCEANGIKPIYSDLKIDGGNVVMLGNKAILTNRVFSENPEYDRETLISKIEDLLKAKVYIIPAYSPSEDVTGHADGMVRFVDEHTILGNDLSEDYDYMKKGIDKVCQIAGLNYIDVPYFIPEKDRNHEMNAIGIYVNYLEVDNLIVLPKFKVNGNRDEETIELFNKIFPDRIIETVNYNEVAVEGGLLNCSTWTIKE